MTEALASQQSSRSCNNNFTSAQGKLTTHKTTGALNESSPQHIAWVGNRIGIIKRQTVEKQILKVNFNYMATLCYSDLSRYLRGIPLYIKNGHPQKVYKNKQWAGLEERKKPPGP